MVRPGHFLCLTPRLVQARGPGAAVTCSPFKYIFVEGCGGGDSKNLSPGNLNHFLRHEQSKICCRPSARPRIVISPELYDYYLEKLKI